MVPKYDIETVQTEWVAPMIFVFKKNEMLRFCVDHRNLNHETKRDLYSVRYMNECIDSLNEADVSSTLDSCSSYWHIKSGEIYKKTSAFTTHHGSYCFICMRSGLKHFPWHFSTYYGREPIKR